MISYSLFEHFELIVHQVYENLVLIYFTLLYDFDRALYLSLFVFGAHDLSKGATAQLFMQFVIVKNVFDLFETFEVLEGYHSAVRLCVLHT